jgi:class 3 adenylate cyclase
VNIASRLQAKAPSGGIMAAARTHGLANMGLTKTEAEWEGPDFIRVKGIDKDIEVYWIDSSAFEQNTE